MAKIQDRTKRVNVTIDPKAVQESGLLKNTLILDIPDEDGDFETTMVRDATLDFVDVSKRWADYCEREAVEQPVLPLLVIQIPNRTEGERNTEKGAKEEDTLIHRVLETVRKHWPDLPEDGVAHVLGDRGTIAVGAYEIPRVAPQDVQHDNRVRVLIAKDAVSTGWDCPRAEVLVSLRPGRDHTYVTQLLGRMVRTPLAQQTSEDRLNSASCYLPRFSKETAKVVAEEIMGLREPSGFGGGATIAKVLLRPVTLQANSEVADDVRTLLRGLPSYGKPAASPRPIKRLLTAAQALAQDALVADADQMAHDALFAVLDAFSAKFATEVTAQAKEVMTADIRQMRIERGETAATETSTQRSADAATVEDALRHLRRLISVSVVNRYLSRDMQQAINAAVEEGDDPSLVDLTKLRARIAALGLIAIPEGEEPLQVAAEDAADALTRLWLSTNAQAIAALPDSRQPTYDAIRDMARVAERADVEIKTEEQVDTVDTDRKTLPTARRHVLSNSDGDFPLDARLNRWERAVIAEELRDGSVAGWYRNPSSAGKHSLRIAFGDGKSWKSVQPDLIFYS